MNAHIQVKHLLPAWETFRNATNIAPIRDAAHYQSMVAMLEALRIANSKALPRVSLTA